MTTFHFPPITSRVASTGRWKAGASPSSLVILRRTEENNWSTSDMSGCRISASLSHGGRNHGNYGSPMRLAEGNGGVAVRSGAAAVHGEDPQQAPTRATRSRRSVRLGPRHPPQGRLRDEHGTHLRGCLLPARTQACGVPSAPSVRRPWPPRPRPSSNRPHLPDHRLVLSLIGPRGSQAVDRTRRLHRRAVTIRANHRRQAQPARLPAAHGRQEPAPKKVKETDAIFQNLTEVHRRAVGSEETLRLSCDAKAPVLIGPFSRGGKSRRGIRGVDHDFKPWGKLTPFGIFLPDQKELNFYFTASKVTSDFIVDRLDQWWQANRGRHPRIRKL